MLEIWLSAGYILLLAIVFFAFLLWRTGGLFAAIAALVVGLPLWAWWEYARPTWTTGLVSGTEARRTGADAGGSTRHVQYIDLRPLSTAGLQLYNEAPW